MTEEIKKSDEDLFKCKYCGHQELPYKSQTVSGVGWILFVVLLLFCFPLCWLPFVVDGCKDTVLKCRKCGNKVN